MLVRFIANQTRVSYLDHLFPREVVVHGGKPFRARTGCPKCDEPSEDTEAEPVTADGSAYPDHYKLTPGRWWVEGENGRWLVILHKLLSKKHGKPWYLQIRPPEAHMTVTLSDYEPPRPKPKLQAVK